MDDLELEKNVNYVFETPTGGILRMKNGAAIIIRGNDAEILPSLEEYHLKYEDDSSTWNELTNDQDKRNFYEANAAALTKIKWIDVEAVIAAAQKSKAVEKRKSFKESLKDGFLRFLGLLTAIMVMKRIDVAWYWDIAIFTAIYFGVIVVCQIIDRLLQLAWSRWHPRRITGVPRA